MIIEMEELLLFHFVKVLQQPNKYWTFVAPHILQVYVHLKDFLITLLNVSYLKSGWNLAQ